MTVVRVECWVLRAPIAVPVRSSFAAMHDRPAVFLRLHARDGAWGWGEVFCNFPQVGAEHRARLVDSIFTPLVVGQASNAPDALLPLLEQRTHRMAIQCGEPGPFAQVIAAFDQAMWDMAARRAGQPLWRFLRGSQAAAGGSPSVAVYASGIGPDQVVRMALERQQQGYRAFKLKVGFGGQTDVHNLRALREALGQDACIMLDANQGWTPADAAQRIGELAPFDPCWIEEPLAADEPAQSWRALAAGSRVPIAAGENLRGLAQFDAALAAGYLRFVQPDVAKWGGFTGGLAVGRRAAAAGATLCPHSLGGALVLAASLQLRAALGDAGFVEVDANPNPLRDEVVPPITLREGRAQLTEAPGLGVEPDPVLMQRYRVA